MDSLEGIQEPEINDEIKDEITEPTEIEEPTETPEPEPGEGEPPAPEEYTPDFTFKYKDEQFEFDEAHRGWIKNKDDEQKLRDFYTAEKAIAEYKEIGGVREIQEKLGKYSDLEEGYNSNNQLNDEINQLSAMLATNSTAGVEAFREHLGIDKNLLLKWAAEEARAMQDPDQANQIYQQRQMGIENFNLQYQNQMMHNSQETQLVQQRNVELDSLLGSNDVSQAFDNLVGTPGSFREEVIRYGTEVARSTGQQISYADAIQAVQGKYQGLVTSPTSGTNTEQTPQNPPQIKSDPQQTVVIRQEGKTTLPNVGGGNASPAKQKFTSLDAIKAHAKTL